MKYWFRLLIFQSVMFKIDVKRVRRAFKERTPSEELLNTVLDTGK